MLQLLHACKMSTACVRYMPVTCLSIIMIGNPAECLLQTVQIMRIVTAVQEYDMQSYSRLQGSVPVA